MTASHAAAADVRIEDGRLVTGRGTYVANLADDRTLHAAFVRSPLAHARCTRVGTAEAARAPGVVAVLTNADLALPDLPAPSGLPGRNRPVLARDTVRFVGEAVALVVAETRALAEDAAELVEVDYEPLPAAVTPEQAAAHDAPRLFPEVGGNVVHEETRGDGRALEGAEVVVTGHFVNQRVAAVPMEPNALLAVPDGGRLTAWVSTQVPFRIRTLLARTLGLDEEQLRVVAPDVGGGFGPKLGYYPEYAATAAAALRLGRPVMWAETRSENLLAMAHGRGHLQTVQLGATRDGRLTGLRTEVTVDCGAYPSAGAAILMPARTYTMGCGPYGIGAVELRLRSVVTNTTPMGAYRGAGRPEITALLERAVDLMAVELGMDPVELRRRNLIPPDAFPYTTPTGMVYDTGDYAAALDEVVRLAGYGELRREQAERRAAGATRLLGIGLSTHVEDSGVALDELGEVEVDRDGTVTVRAGLSPQGQGHETAVVQLMTMVLGVPPDRVRVLHSDTDLVRSAAGTMGSRSLQVAGSAVHVAGRSVLELGRRLAAHLLEAAEGDVDLFEDGRIGVRGSPETGLTWAELAQAAEDPERRPDWLTDGLRSAEVFTQEALTFPSGTHLAVVEVDTETGRVDLRRMVAADDCGRVLNPVLATAQIHGGLAQGIAQALYEEVVYDEQGNPRTSSLIDYLVPTAGDLPPFELVHKETPTPLNPLGAKGIGEAPAVGAPPAVQNAVVDALSHLGVRHLDMPLTPERVWRAIAAATADAP